MLISISKKEAFKMLLDEETADKVYYKGSDGYFRTIDYRWAFKHNTSYSGCINFIETNFYKEVQK